MKALFCRIHCYAFMYNQKKNYIYKCTNKLMNTRALMHSLIVLKLTLSINGVIEVCLYEIKILKCQISVTN